MGARAGVEPTTLRLKVIVSTKAPQRPKTIIIIIITIIVVVIVIIIIIIIQCIRQLCMYLSIALYILGPIGGSLVSNVPSVPHYVSSRLLGLAQVYLGLPSVLVSITFSPFRLPYFDVLFHSLFFTCHWFSFVFLLYDRRICTHSIDPSLADGGFLGLGLAQVYPVLWSHAEAEHEAEISFQISTMAGVWTSDLAV